MCRILLLLYGCVDDLCPFLYLQADEPRYLGTGEALVAGKGLTLASKLTA